MHTAKPFIDAHVHLWDAARREDILVLQSQPELIDSATIPALAAMLDATGARGSIVVQAEPSVSHAQWLLDAAETLPFITGVVAWVDPASADLSATLDGFAAKSSKLVGIRLMLNRMAEPAALMQPSQIAGLRRVTACGLAIEMLVPANLLPLAAQLSAMLPDARLVLDHGGLPPADKQALRAWRRDLGGFARLHNVATKFSGLIEKIGLRYTVGDVRERFDPMLEVFGAARIMAASNWPVTDLAGGAAQWFQTVWPLVDALGEDGGAADIRAGTASRFFGICLGADRSSDLR